MAQENPDLKGAPIAGAGSGVKYFQMALAGLGFCCLGLITLWALAALVIDVRILALRWPLAVAYVGALIAVWVRARRPWNIVLTIAGFLVVLAWWLTLQPSNDRNWERDLALLAYADIAGDKVTIHNIRNCDFRTAENYDLRYYDKTFDLSKLVSTDFYLITWGVPYIAHTMVSFGFEGGDYVCFSIETRKVQNQNYSALLGFFRQFELIYIIADERDVVRVRTNYRHGDDVYLYRVLATPQEGRELLLEYLHRANQLRERPEWYNAVTDNCTTAIRAQRTAAERGPWNWRLLANAYIDELFYMRHWIDTELPFTELKTRSLINARAKAADQEADFSQKIRDGLPGFVGSQ